MDTCLQAGGVRELFKHKTYRGVARTVLCTFQIVPYEPALRSCTGYVTDGFRRALLSLKAIHATWTPSPTSPPVVIVLRQAQSEAHAQVIKVAQAAGAQTVRAWAVSTPPEERSPPPKAVDPREELLQLLVAGR